ncbi:MAG TPA: hypothetical protein VHZ95_04255 [Polyangiales bacterium]|nr:hypothetical protein [Polyangiales bacterium]
MSGLSTVLLSALAACGGDKPAAPAAPPPSAAEATPAPAPAPVAPAGTLKGICPDKVVIQTDWFATPERAAAYQLIGPGGSVDKKKGTYSGAVAGTGITVEVRLGGPFIGFQPIPALMYQDPSIYLGYVATDDAVIAADKFPTIAVVAPLDINPQVIMWDPATYTINSWSDVAKTKAKIIYIEGLPFMDYLVSKGLVSASQKDASFDGTPSRFVAERGKPIQQGYASNEPYRWEHDVEGWKKPVKFLLVHDSGYEIYPQGLAVRTSQLAADSACLKLLVPMIQKAQLDYTNSPDATNAALLTIAQTLGEGPPVTAAGNANAVVVMKDLKIVGNGPDTTLGNFDMARVDRTIALLKPLFAARGVKVPEKLAASDIVTDQFIDPSLHL